MGLSGPYVQVSSSGMRSKVWKELRARRDAPSGPTDISAAAERRSASCSRSQNSSCCSAYTSAASGQSSSAVNASRSRRTSRSVRERPCARGCSLLDQSLVHHRVMKRERRLEMRCGCRQIQRRTVTLDVVGQVPDFDVPSASSKSSNSPSRFASTVPPGRHHPPDSVPERPLTLDEQNVRALPRQRDRRRQQPASPPPTTSTSKPGRFLTMSKRKRLRPDGLDRQDGRWPRRRLLAVGIQQMLLDICARGCRRRYGGVP